MKGVYKMKKLFALVLTFALVLAVAAPAAAAGWGSTNPSATFPFDTAVTLLQSNTDATGRTYYTAYSGTGVVAGSPVYFQVDFRVPTPAELSNYYGSSVPSVQATVALKNLTYVQEASDPDNIASASGSTITINLGGKTGGTTYSAIFSAVVASTGAATVTSTYGGVASTWSGSISKTVNNVTYTITANGISATPYGSLTLTLNSSSVVTGMTMTVPSYGNYTVNAGPSFQYISGGSILTLASTDPAYSTVLTAYNALTGVLGFGAGASGIYFTPANILANYGYATVDTAVGTYNAYSTTPTIPNSDNTTVPNTGDETSTVGFVMIGLAILATAAVIVKKVRT